MKISVKIIYSIVIFFIIIVTGLALISYNVVKMPLPEYDGKIETGYLNNEVRIYRDSAAVPFIYAETEEQAAFALGFVHAQERMFQMDLIRRAGEGRLSEIFGNRVIAFDRMFRTIGLMRNVKQYYERLNGTTKTMLAAYSEGVNAYLESRSDYSFEFNVLGYDPEKWQPYHSLLVAKLMAWELNISWWTDIAFSHLLQKFGPEKAAEILPAFDENAPTIMPSNLLSALDTNLDFIETDRQFRDFMNYTGTHIGSNNWVVNGKKSASGKVLIANDPHLGFSVPGKWFIAGIRAGNWNAEGFTLPGVPAVVIGKNKNISWVLTNVMTDDADFYVEQFDSTGTKYLVDDIWRDLNVFDDTIKVKDSSNVVVRIKQTHRGPVISGIHPYKNLFPDSLRPKSMISMRWTALDFSDEYFGIYSVNKAENWAQFEEAVSYFTVPGQNFVYGDKENNIGYICATKLPVRNSNSPTLIYDGTSSANDWTGFVPYERMPKLFNPSENFIASANNKTVANFPYHISNIWEPSSRIKRIRELITSKELLGVEDYKLMQNDFYSFYARNVVERLLKSFENATITDANLNKSLTLLKEWNFNLNKYSQAPAIYLVFFQKLLENTFSDEMGESLFKEYLFVANVPYRMIEEIINGKDVSWIDNVNTPEKESFDDIIRKSLIDALSYLETNYGENIEEWQWLKLHTVTFKHPFSGLTGLTDRIVNVGPFDISGDGTTIFNTEYSFTDPYSVKLGPSMRYIYDFDNPDVINYILPTGQSGHIMSDHYKDMTSKWLNGGYNRLNINDDFIRSKSPYLLILR